MQYVSDANYGEESDAPGENRHLAFNILLSGTSENPADSFICGI